ncbi:hypothetical protein LTR62_005034 [Meristemomyces frigidus]|uniref:Checkpoint protein RAD24-like helical bundle domain-containing protein n=1 Tax=Meristemomyces frigidus TaxID=1508187 RepID=A0AAN7TWC0_9PEZI|nr:hypothetical protein LTR62_005034 [Meristemomyces frigidus]
MGQPRASRRKTVVLSSDEEDDSGPEPVAKTRDHIKQEPSPDRTKTIKDSKARVLSTIAIAGVSAKSPAKSKPIKAKSKASTTDAPDTKDRSIFSFFNATTQRQQRARTSPSPEKSASQVEIEVINDDSGGESKGVALSKGSSTALTLRKRKVQQSTSFGNNSSLPPTTTQKFRKTADGGRTPSISLSNDDQRTWVDQFGPSGVDDLAVHKRKVTDVRQWLETTMRGRRQKVLVLKGSAGTGKTATIRMLAKDMGIDLSEWHNPTNFDSTTETTVSAASQFHEFVSRAGRANGLEFANHEISSPTSDATETFQPLPADTARRKKQVLLIEEFPTTFSLYASGLQAFRSTVAQYLSTAISSDALVVPMVLIISETLLSTTTAAADSFTVHRLLGPELANHPFIDTIEFNPIAPSILSKALEAVVIKEARKSGRRKTPGPQVIKRLVETGDIRSAISSLEFLCLRNNDENAWSGKIHFTKPRKKIELPMTEAEEEALKLVSNRESTLGIFHAVGKIIYNKRIDVSPGAANAQPPVWLSQHRRSKLPETDVDILIDELGTQTSTFIAALHENYALSCASLSREETLDSLEGCANHISDADLLSIDRFSTSNNAASGSAMDSLRQDEMAFQVAARGLLFDLPSPVHRGVPPGGSKADSFRMLYPASVKIWKRQEEIGSLLDLLTARAQAGKLKDMSPGVNLHSGGATGGVESWSRNQTFQSMPDDVHRAIQAPGMTSAATRVDMLLERLPFMVHIRAKDATLLTHINKVSRISAGRVPMHSDSQAADDDDDENAGAADVWSTDLPENESSLPKRHPPRSAKLTAKTGKNENNSPVMDVSPGVEGLILEDDDIVDD